jgi:hypothetical protein
MVRVPLNECINFTEMIRKRFCIGKTPVAPKAKSGAPKSAQFFPFIILTFRWRAEASSHPCQNLAAFWTTVQLIFGAFPRLLTVEA